MAGMEQMVDIDGRQLKLTNLDKVLYPESGTTKSEVIAYFATAAETMLPWLRDRPVTRKRWPHGVESESFFEKNLPKGTPEWVPRVTIHHSGVRSGNGPRDLDYPLVDEVATLVWLAQIGALELHAPQWRVDRRTGEPLPPDRLVIDLDPGPPAGLAECATVALLARQMLEAHGMPTLAVTSGSKGMQLYADLPPKNAAGKKTLEKAGRTAEYAHALALVLEKELPKLVVSAMSRELRPGKIFVDWSQNNPAKTTIVPWSLRGLHLPTAATPVAWEDVERGELAQASMQQATAALTADR